MKEQVIYSHQGQSISDRQMSDESELNLQNTSGNTSDDIMHNLSYAFGPFLTRDCEKASFEDMLSMESQNSGSNENVPMDGSVGHDEPLKLKSQTELEESLLKGSLDYSGLSLPDVSNPMDRFGVFDDNPSTLFGNVDFDDIINKQSKNASLIMTCVENMLPRDQQHLLLNDDYVDLSFKNQSQLGMLDRGTGSDNFSGDMLVVDDISEWDGHTNEESLNDVGPLNLAGPQDLSLGLEKRRFFCSACGTLYNSETRHVCKSRNFSSALVTSEPLNLKSQPLDLSTGPIYLAMDGSITQPVLNGSSGVSYDLLTKHTLNCSVDTSDGYKMCDTCGKYLYSNSGYLKHKKQHAGKYRYVCEFCHKGFFDQTNLKTHIDSTHSKLKKYECKYCVKSFFWKHHLKRHNETCKGLPATSTMTTTNGAAVVALVPASVSTTPSLPVISNFLLSLTGQHISKTFKNSNKDKPNSQSSEQQKQLHFSTTSNQQVVQQTQQVVQQTQQTSGEKSGHYLNPTSGFSFFKKNVLTTDATKPNLCLIASPSDITKYLKILPVISSSNPASGVPLIAPKSSSFTLVPVPSSSFIQIKNVTQMSPQNVVQISPPSSSPSSLVWPSFSSASFFTSLGALKPQEPPQQPPSSFTPTAAVSSSGPLSSVLNSLVSSSSSLTTSTLL